LLQAFKGYWPLNCKDDYDHFGEDTPRMLEEEPELLVEIQGHIQKKSGGDRRGI
jgi:hypothetical protein